MRKFLTTMFLAFLVISPGWSQEEPQAEQEDESATVTEAADGEAGEAEASTGRPEAADEEPEAPEEQPETVVASSASEIDDSDLDEQTYEEDDDDFVPSEEIPTDESIPFPSNI